MGLDQRLGFHQLHGGTQEINRAIQCFEKAEKKAITDLQLGGMIGIGYTNPHDEYPTVVPHQHWFFLTLDFEESNATASDLNYVGLRFVFRDELTEDQVQNLEATRKSTAVRLTEVTQSRSLRDLNISTWEDLCLRFLKGNFVEVGGPEQKMRFSLAEVGLINRTKSEPNASCEMLFQMAKHVFFIPNKGTKQKISTLRRTLQKALRLSGDPFQIEGARGYVPRFQLIDGRDALDQRAKEKAIHHPFNDELQADKQEPDDQDGYSYEEDWEMQGDEASLYIRKRTGR